jgi:predicted RNA methylase
MRSGEFVHWFEALEARHLSNLTFPEVRRAVQALSGQYTFRHGTDAFSGAGKRAAFALFFGPLHFLLVREIVRALGASVPKGADIVDLGCGTGVAGAAWALEMKRRPKVYGVDRNPWALQECQWTYEHFRLRGLTKSADVKKFWIPDESAVIAAFTINELEAAQQESFLEDFIEISPMGSPVLVIEPIARRISPWWDEWARRFIAAGGRADEWRFPVELPERLALMDRAAGLDHRELTGRSLWLPSSS